LPLRNEDVLVTIAGKTASVAVSNNSGVTVSVSLPAPVVARPGDEEDVEPRLLADAAAALQSALGRLLHD
jgi:hypothetical protein